MDLGLRSGLSAGSLAIALDAKGIMAAKPLVPILFVPDTHRPYHDKRAWKLMMKAAWKLKPGIIAIIGDFADFYAVSAHSKKPREKTQMREEMEDVNHGLDELDALGAKRKIFVAGNHEDRLRRYLQDKAPELFDTTDVAKELKLAARGWEYVPYKDHTSIGKLYVTHDVGSSGKYSVYRALDAFAHSVASGHAHRFAYIVQGDATGVAKLSVQFGHLLDVQQVDYMQRIKAQTDWALGFGVGYLDPSTGYVYVVPVPIVDYTCMVNGEVFRA